jgi:hypothetical protein
VRAAGVKLRKFRRASSFSILLLICAALTSCGPETAVAAAKSNQLTIKITNLNPKVKMAVARVIETKEAAALEHGKFELSACAPGQTISIWAIGYYIKTFRCDGRLPPEYSIELELLNPADDPNYAWVAADIRFDSIFHCKLCHSDSFQDLNEYPEWEIDGHSGAFANPYFWTTYLGTNVNRALGQKTIWGFSPDGSKFRLPSDPNLDYGPGYQLDYPDTSGNCAFCHAPAAVGATHQEVNLAPLIKDSWGQKVNAASEGITCDVCHKVIDVTLDSQKLPYTDRPGILSFSFLRPTSGLQFIAGPWSHWVTSVADVKRTCAPIFSESSFCAPCHYAKFAGVEIYGSYKEWLDSPYSKPGQSFRSCQDCHMQASQQINGITKAAPAACSPEDDSFQNFSHNMMNRDNVENPVLVQGAAAVEIDASRGEGKIKVNIKVVNTGAGHKLPTDSPLRHLILVVEAKDINGMLLSQVDGPRIPDWGGTGNQPEAYAGKPGVIYANILKDKDTNGIPAVDYWNPTAPAWKGSDNRLVPNEDALSQYFFVAPSHGEVTITANLIYRSAFINIARKKGWSVRDILVNWAQNIIE